MSNIMFNIMEYPTAGCKIKLILILILFLFTGFEAKTLHASNYNWVQSDWLGGADTRIQGDCSVNVNDRGASFHPCDQTGWTKFYSKDSYVDTSIIGQISLVPKPASWTQTAD